MLLLPMQTDAQKLESGLRGRVPVSVLQKAERTTPAALRKLDEKVKASYPKLFKGKIFNQNKFSGLKEMRSGGIMPAMALEPRVPLRQPNTYLKESCGELFLTTTHGRRTILSMASTSSRLQATSVLKPLD